MEYPPIPISEKILRLAMKLKKAGLDWDPSVGSFVWDPEKVVKAPSPFPKRVYFVLSLKRFLEIFGSPESMKKHLVWIPTEYQLIQYARKKGLELQLEPSGDSEENLVGLYRRALAAFEHSR